MHPSVRNDGQNSPCCNRQSCCQAKPGRADKTKHPELGNISTGLSNQSLLKFRAFCLRGQLWTSPGSSCALFPITGSVLVLLPPSELASTRVLWLLLLLLFLLVLMLMVLLMMLVSVLMAIELLMSIPLMSILLMTMLLMTIRSLMTIRPLAMMPLSLLLR